MKGWYNHSICTWHLNLWFIFKLLKHYVQFLIDFYSNELLLLLVYNWLTHWLGQVFEAIQFAVTFFYRSGKRVLGFWKNLRQAPKITRLFQIIPSINDDSHYVRSQEMYHVNHARISYFVLTQQSWPFKYIYSPRYLITIFVTTNCML